MAEILLAVGAKTLLSFGVEKLWDLLVRESERLQGFDEQFDELKRDLNKLSVFLEDADAKKHTNKMVKTCVEEIKEIVFDAEDLIETFLLKKELGQTSIRKRMRRLSWIIFDRREIALEMGGITKRISKVIRDMESFGVQPMKIVEGGESSHPLQERQREIRKTFPSDSENDLVGLEENVKKLVGYLVEEDSIQVVSITGMGCIGKTTLARQVFNHEMVKNHFDRVAWVCISQQFERTYVLQTILRQLSSKHDEHRELNMTEDDLHKKLFLLLETGNYLIVLDDMWKEEDWDRIKPVFPKKKGWKVLLTSRNERVALRADPTCVPFKPECLTIEESWTLFRRIAFPRKDTSEHKIDEEMEKMGKKMINHCGGLPLAVKVLGGLLAARHTLSEWKRISENIKSHIVGGTSFNDRNVSSFYHILYLSFEELPVYLKQCFLYLAHFPEDFTIYVEDLAYYWAVEGILRLRYYDGATIREVANGYIEELVKRNMVISEGDVTTSRYETCHLHDMMRGVCLRKAKEENFVHIVGIANSQSPCTSRRVAVHKLDKTDHPKWEMQNPKLRSLLIIPKQFSGIKWVTSGLCFTKLQLMRVLDFCYAEFEGGKLPSSIGKLVHLRYLSLYQAYVTHLPSSMRNLKQLIYLNLNVSGESLIYIPNILKEMRELTYLSLPWMHDKTKLELGNLVNLETLKNFSTKYSSVKDLQRMTKLRKLSINIEGKRCATETLSSSLSVLRHLEDLKIYEGSTNDEGFVLDCVNLKQLDLRIYMPKLPDEHHFSSHLTTISLQLCHLREDPMPILEKLVQLKQLNLCYNSFSGRKIVCTTGGFPQLHTLSLHGLWEWEEWIVEEGSMPLLHTLEILNCAKLKKLPAGGGFPQLLKLSIRKLKEWKEWIVEEGSMPLLHTLTIWDCPKLKKLPAGGGFPQLHTLYLFGLEEWEEWIVEEGSMPLLHTLLISRCPKLKELPDGGFPQLHELELNGLKEWEEWIVEEGSMPLLQYVSIRNCPKLKKLPACGFPQLQDLSLHELEEWEEWIVEEDSMPLLHSLEIRKCPNLKELPDGLRFINSLKELIMEEEWKERLSEGGEDYYKVKHIPSVEFDEERNFYDSLKRI